MFLHVPLFVLTRSLVVLTGHPIGNFNVGPFVSQIELVQGQTQVPLELTGIGSPGGTVAPV